MRRMRRAVKWASKKRVDFKNVCGGVGEEPKLKTDTTNYMCGGKVLKEIGSEVTIKPPHEEAGRGIENYLVCVDVAGTKGCSSNKYRP